MHFTCLWLKLLFTFYSLFYRLSELWISLQCLSFLLNSGLQTIICAQSCVQAFNFPVVPLRLWAGCVSFHVALSLSLFFLLIILKAEAATVVLVMFLLLSEKLFCFPACSCFLHLPCVLHLYQVSPDNYRIALLAGTGLYPHLSAKAPSSVGSYTS